MESNKIKITNENKLAIKRIIKDFPDEDMDKWPISQEIEFLANEFIHDYITTMFTNGKEYYKKK